MNSDPISLTVRRPGRGPRLIGWMLLGLLLLGLLAPAVLSIMSGRVVAQAQSDHSETAPWRNERADFWRQVRRGETGYTAVGGQERGVLIQGNGENWRVFRSGMMITFGAWLMAFVLFMAGFLHVINGAQKIEKGRSGLVIERWSGFERMVHWTVASLFLILALTGLSLLYGRTLLIPLLGKDGFAAYALIAKNLHNFIGPFFSAGLLLMIVIWFKDNLPIKADLEWAKTAGGMWGQGHPPADRMNAGEKLMYWQFALFGIAVIVSGFILDFPNFGQSRTVMQWAQVVHVLFAIGMIVTAMGHLYMALVGVEGAMEGMIVGKVDTHWAEQHHNLWYEKRLQQGTRVEPAAGPGPAPPPTRPAEA